LNVNDISKDALDLLNQDELSNFKTTYSKVINDPTKLSAYSNIINNEYPNAAQVKNISEPMQKTQSNISAFMQSNNENSPVRLKEKAIKSIDKFLSNKGAGLLFEFKQRLTELRNTIEEEGIDPLLNVKDSMKWGYSSSLRKIATNLNNSVVVDNRSGLPKWQYGISPWKTADSFIKGIITEDRYLGGRRTHKKKSKMQKRGRTKKEN